MKRAAILLLAMGLWGVAGSALAQANTGWLNVSSTPTAEIFIDDADTQLKTPQTQMPLSAGHHNLRLQTDDGRQSKIGFTVTAGQTTTLSMTPH